MHKEALLLTSLLTTGCTFEAEVGAADATVTPGVDAPKPPDAATPDAAVPIDAPPQLLCSTSDGALRLCLEFEDATLSVALDGAGSHHDAAMTGATASMRDVPATSRAIGLGASTAITIPDTSDLDLQTLTLTAWVKRSTLPSFGRNLGVIDIGQRQAALAIDDEGRVICFVKTSSTLWFRTGGSTGNGEWALAACTYDAPTLCAYSFRNGSSTTSVTCGNTNSAPLDTSESSGTAVGAMFDDANQLTSKFAGSIDSVRVYGRALSQSELCTAGGLAGC